MFATFEFIYGKLQENTYNKSRKKCSDRVKKYKATSKKFKVVNRTYRSTKIRAGVEWVVVRSPILV